MYSLGFQYFWKSDISPTCKSRKQTNILKLLFSFVFQARLPVKKTNDKKN